MKLYYAPGACSLAVNIALRETGRPFEAVKVDLATHRTAGGIDYKTLSPRGYVPLLEWDDGTRYTEAAALLQMVADLDPAHTLIGAPGSRRRREVIQWVAFVASELHKGFSPWLWSKDTAASTRTVVVTRLHARFAELDELLTRTDYLAGDFSVADAYAFTVINWTRFLDISLTAYPRLQAYLARIAQRPKVTEALRAEGLLV